MTQHLACFAQYFRVGLEVGGCTPEQAREWAFAVIDQMAGPPGDVIEVSWQKPLAQLISDLNDIKGESDQQLVCGWLLGSLWKTMQSTNDDLGHKVRQAMQIALSVGTTGQYDLFNGLDDMINLAESRTYGSIEACRKAFDVALKDHATIPFVNVQELVVLAQT